MNSILGAAKELGTLVLDCCISRPILEWNNSMILFLGHLLVPRAKVVDLETLLLDYYEMKPLLFVFYSEDYHIDV